MKHIKEKMRPIDESTLGGMHAAFLLSADCDLILLIKKLEALDRRMEDPYLSKQEIIPDLRELFNKLSHVRSRYSESISSWIRVNMPKHQQLWDVLLAGTLEFVENSLSYVESVDAVNGQGCLSWDLSPGYLHLVGITYDEFVQLRKDDLSNDLFNRIYPYYVSNKGGVSVLYKAVRTIYAFVDCYEMSSTFRRCFYLKSYSAEQMKTCLLKLHWTLDDYNFIISKASSKNELASISRKLHFMESVLSPPHYTTLLGVREDHEAPNDLLDDIEVLLSNAWEAIIDFSCSSLYYQGVNTAVNFISIAIYTQVSINERRGKSGGKSEETAVPLQHQKRGSSLSWIDEIGVTFWDCILESMLEILQQESSQLVQWKDQNKALHKQLRFFNYFLTDSPVELTSKRNFIDLSDTIKVTISRPLTPLILSSYYPNNYGKICKDANIVMRKTIRIINLFERETFSHRPRTDDEFGSVDYFLEKLEILIRHGSLTSVKKQPLDKALEELTSLQTSIYNITNKRKEYEKLKSLCSRIGDVAYAMGYIVHSLRGGICPASHLTQWFSDLEKDTNLIKKKVNAISRKYISSNHDHDVTRSSNYKLSHGDDLIIDEEIVGFVEDENKVIELIVGGSEDKEMFMISGMPGLGKTTLAKKVYNNQIVVDRFYVRSWCCVSQGFQRKDLLVQILKHITLFEESMDENRLAEILRKELMQRRYLIVMDDIWDSTAWDEIRMCFPDNKNGSRILLTSRFNDLPFLSITKIHILNPLSDDESWELLRKKLLLAENRYSELLEIGNRIAKGCKGVPLVVVLVAGLLADMNLEQWQKVACNSTAFVVNDSQRQYRYIRNKLQELTLLSEAMLALFWVFSTRF